MKAAKGDSIKTRSGADLRAQAEQYAAERGVPKAAAARTRVETIRTGMRSWVKMRAAIVEAFALDDWVTLGYSSWQAYLDTEFSLNQLRLSGEELRASAAEFQAAGMNLREIGAATGTSKATASRALKPSRVSSETRSPLVDALRGAIEDAAISADSFRCEKCDRLLAEGIVRAAQRRCLNCDVDRIHAAQEVGGPCMECTKTSAASSVAAADTDRSPSPAVGVPVDADRAAAQTGTGPEPVARGLGSGTPEHQQENGWAGEPGQCGVSCTCGAMWDGFETLTEPLELLRQHIANPEERIEEEAVEPLVDTPGSGETSPSPSGAEDAAIPPAAPEGDDLDPVPSSSSGESSPPDFGSEGFLGRAETSHHLVEGWGGGQAPGSVRADPVEPVLEGGGSHAPAESPSSSDPAVLLLLFAAFVDALDRFDVDAIAPLLLTGEMQSLHQHADRVAQFVGLLETWRSRVAPGRRSP